MKKQNQSGLATVEIILFVIVFALIGFIGWYVMGQNKSSKDTSDQAIKASESSPVKAATASNKFVFKELGVQFDLPSDLKGLAYQTDTLTNEDGTKGVTLYLYTPDLLTTFEKCYGEKPTADNTPSFGAIGKLDGQYKEPGPNDGPVDPLLKQFDTFYISGGFPNGITNCSAPGVDESLMHNKASALNTSFTDAFQKTATKVQ